MQQLGSDAPIPEWRARFDIARCAQIVRNHATYFGHEMISTAVFCCIADVSIERMVLVSASANDANLHDIKPHSSDPEVGGFISTQTVRDGKGILVGWPV